MCLKKTKFPNVNFCKYMYLEIYIKWSLTYFGVIKNMSNWYEMWHLYHGLEQGDILRY
jgi:hypothetical protein